MNKKKKIKEVTLSELLETDFTINENMEMVGTFTLDRINMIGDILTNLQEENERTKKLKERYQLEKESYKSRNEKAIEKLESIRAFGLRSSKTLFSTLINETIDILRGDE